MELSLAFCIVAFFGYCLLEYAAWRDANTEPEPKCDNAKVRVCNAPDYFYRYSGGSNESKQ